MYVKFSVCVTYNVLRAGDRSPVLRLRQGYGACTLLPAAFVYFSVRSFILLALQQI